MGEIEEAKIIEIQTVKAEETNPEYVNPEDAKMLSGRKSQRKPGEKRGRRAGTRPRPHEEVIRAKEDARLAMLKKQEENIAKAQRGEFGVGANGKNRLRPPMPGAGVEKRFKTPEELQVVVDDYFEVCKNHKKKVLTKQGDVVEIDDPLIPTLADFAYAIGLSRHTVYQYEHNHGDEYGKIIIEARDRIMAAIESSTVNTSGNPAGKIFIAKNYGYTDRQQVEVAMGVKIIKDTI